MANPRTLPVTLVTILLLVAPGYLAIRVFLRAAERNDTLDRTGKIVWSSAASLVSLLLLYVTSPVHFDWVVTRGVTLTEGVGVVTEAELFGISLATGVLLYVGHLLVLFAATGLLGVGSRWSGDDDRDRREPWRYAFDDAGEGRIEVSLEDSSRIRGYFDPFAWDSSRKGLYLRDPVRVTDDGSESVGRSMLVRSEWITGVVFFEDDPNSERMKGTTVSTEGQSLAEFIESLDPDPEVTLDDPRQTEESDDDLDDSDVGDTEGDEDSEL
jgi:hypothetical protein